MKKRILFIIVLVIIKFSVFSQNIKLNWTIFIDGNIPKDIMNRTFICFEGDSNERRIDFTYIVGEIQISKEDFEYIKKNGGDMRSITMEISYTEIIKTKFNTYTYSFKIPPKLLLPINDYVVLRITNLNKKKDIFYWGYTTGYENVAWHPKEARIFLPNTNVKVDNKKPWFDKKEVIMKEEIWPSDDKKSRLR